MGTRRVLSEKERLLNNLESKRKYRESHKERTKEYGKTYRELNSTKIAESGKAYREENKDKIAKTHREYAESHRSERSRREAERRSRQKQAIFVGRDQEFYDLFMEEIYELSGKRSELTGVLHHVDHIIPLTSNTVCGLHTPENLRVIPALHNQRKGNRY